MSSAWKRANRILCVRLDSIGDVLMSEPAMRALKQDEPNREITLLTSKSGAQIAPFLPSLDRTLVYAAPWMKPTHIQRPEDDLAFIDFLRAERFDAAVIFTVYSQSPFPAALLTYLSGIPLRLAHARENPYRLLTDWVRDTEPQSGVRHEVRRQLDLVGAVGAQLDDERMVINIEPQAMQRIRQRLSEAGLLSRPWLVLHPGATAPSRRYGIEKFAAVARGLSEAGWSVVMTGDAQESELVRDFQNHFSGPFVSMVGSLSMAEFVALLSLTPILISNNTGPVHIAAALGTPIIDLYALTNPQHQPWGGPAAVLTYDVPCRFCYKSICPEEHHACLQNISPEQVLSAALSLLERTRHYKKRSHYHVHTGTERRVS